MKKILFALGLGGVVYGAYKYYMVQSDILYYSKISLANIQVLEKKADLFKLKITLNITNNSEYDFTLKQYDLVIFMNEKKITAIKNSNLNEKLAGDGQTSSISFNVSFNPAQFGLWDILGQLLKTLGKTLVSVKGDIKIQKGILAIDVPLDLTYKLNDFTNKQKKS